MRITLQRLNELAGIGNYDDTMLLFCVVSLLVSFVDAFPQCTSRIKLPTRTSAAKSIHTLSGNANSANTNDECTGGLGLVHGIDDLEKADYFAPRIDISRGAFAWQHLESLAWEAARQDIEEKKVDDESTQSYLQRIVDNFTTFFASDIVGDRELLSGFIGRTITMKGHFSLVLGGVSVGKSIVLQNATRLYNDDKHMVLYVDARGYQKELAKGLAFELAKLKSSLYLQNRLPEDAWVSVLNSFDKFSKTAVMSGATTSVKKYMSDGGVDENTQDSVIGIFEELATMFGNTTKSPPKSDSIIVDFIDFATSQNKYPVIIIDEANEVMDTADKDKGTKSERAEIAAETKRLLTEFVKYTKQENKLSVILATSEYSYPFRLKELLKLRHLSDIIVAGEVSPKDTWKLLVHATYPSGNAKVPGGKPIIGMGPNLAEFLLAAYGGHLLSMRNAVTKLSVLKESFTAATGMPYDLSSEIKTCLRTQGTRKLLAEMAEFGFAPVENPNVPAVEKIAEQDLGGVVSLGSFVTGLPQSVWKKTNPDQSYALIPSSQSLRLVIGEELKYAKRKGWRRIRFWSRF